jgi:aldehyde:ferredoxin oxidoreductase
MSAGAKSPLTGVIKESNSGGTAGQIIARLGLKAIIIEGAPKDDRWYSIHINKDGATIQEETEVIGKGNFDAIEILSARLGAKVALLIAGPAGEMKMLTADISVKDADNHIRCHGRGGLGAVMGSKKVKFISVDGQGGPGVSIADPEAFKEAAKAFANCLKQHPATSQFMPTFGTAGLVNMINGMGALSTRNYRYGQSDQVEKFSGETMHDLIQARGGKTAHACNPGCIIQCSQVYPDKNGKYLTSGFEYETIWSLGANCCIADLDDIAEADHIMDDLGIDSIDTAQAFAVAMEANVLPFGDGKGVLRILREDCAKGTALGRTLCNGAAAAGKAFGITRVAVVKNQALAGYDPRAIKGFGITYATSPMGADHTAGVVIGAPGIDPLAKDGQVELSRNMQIGTVSLDSTALCSFIGMAFTDPNSLPAVVAMVNARNGTNLSIPEFMGGGAPILKAEHNFNLEAGFTNADDRLPAFLASDPLPPHNTTWDFTDQEIDAFWAF